MRIEPDKSFQKMVEISFFDGFLFSLCPKYFLIFIGKICENDVFRWKSFPAPMFDFGLYVCTRFRMRIIVRLVLNSTYTSFLESRSPESRSPQK